MSNPEQQDQDAGPPGNGLGDVEHPHPDPAPGQSGEEADQPVEDGIEPDEEADEASAESFPSSDPPASYAGPDEPSD